MHQPQHEIIGYIPGYQTQLAIDWNAPTNKNKLQKQNSDDTTDSESTALYTSSDVMPMGILCRMMDGPCCSSSGVPTADPEAVGVTPEKRIEHGTSSFDNNSLLEQSSSIDISVDCYEVQQQNYCATTVSITPSHRSSSMAYSLSSCSSTEEGDYFRERGATKGVRIEGGNPPPMPLSSPKARCNNHLDEDGNSLKEDNSQENNADNSFSQWVNSNMDALCYVMTPIHYICGKEYCGFDCDNPKAKANDNSADHADNEEDEIETDTSSHNRHLGMLKNQKGGASFTTDESYSLEEEDASTLSPSLIDYSSSVSIYTGGESTVEVDEYELSTTTTEYRGIGTGRLGILPPHLSDVYDRQLQYNPLVATTQNGTDVVIRDQQSDTVKGEKQYSKSLVQLMLESSLLIPQQEQESRIPPFDTFQFISVDMNISIEDDSASSSSGGLLLPGGGLDNYEGGTGGTPRKSNLSTPGPAGTNKLHLTTRTESPQSPNVKAAGKPATSTTATITNNTKTKATKNNGKNVHRVKWNSTSLKHAKLRKQRRDRLKMISSMDELSISNTFDEPPQQQEEQIQQRKTLQSNQQQQHYDLKRTVSHPQAAADKAKVEAKTGDTVKQTSKDDAEISVRRKAKWAKVRRRKEILRTVTSS